MKKSHFTFVACCVALLAAPIAAQVVLASVPILHDNDYAVGLGDIDGDRVRDLAIVRYDAATRDYLRFDVYSLASGQLLTQVAPSPKTSEWVALAGQHR